MPAKLTQEIAEQRVQQKCKEMNYICSEFVYIGSSTTYLPLKCHCGHEWNSTNYRNFINTDRGCPICGIKKCHEQLKLSQEEAEQKVNDRCKVLNYTCYSFIYNGTDNTYLTLKCNNNHEYETSYSSFVHSNRECSICAGNKKITQEEAELRVHEKCNVLNYKCSSFIYIGKDNTYLPLKCHCGHEWNSTNYNSFIRGSGCPICGIKKCTEQLTLSQKEAEQKVNDRCKVLNYTCSSFVYVNNRTYLPLKCHCGHEWNSTNYSNFMYGNGCPKCGIGESNCIKNDIDPIFGEDIISEKRFKNCKMKKTLPFDRYVPYLNLLLEYDGEQHFNKSNIWYTEDIIIRDKIKTEYAINNGYNFIRIAYYEDHVQVLESFLALVLKHQDKQIVQIYGEVQILDK